MNRIENLHQLQSGASEILSKSCACVRSTTTEMHDKILNLEEDSVDMLVKNLLDHKDFTLTMLRDHQVDTLDKLVDFIGTGKKRGLIKHPTGAGKTRLFCEITAGMYLPTLVLVPRKSLVEQTYEEFMNVGFLEKEVNMIMSDDSPKTAGQKLEEYFQIHERKVLITTYQSLASIARSYPELLERLTSELRLIISDEGHRGLGSHTSKIIKEISVEEVRSLEEEDAMEVDLADIQSVEEYFSRREILNLFFTATPKLHAKSLQEIYDVEVIDSLTAQDLIETGVLVLPRKRGIGKAIAVVDKDTINESELKNLSDGEKYFIDGQPLGIKALEAYVEEKNAVGGYLPGIFFCPTIESAEKWKEEAQNRFGLKAVRVTSDKKGLPKSTSEKEAKRLIESGDVDLVFTVTKVGEGWDVKTLRCAAWLSPTTSPAKSIQGNGRIFRQVSSQFPIKSSANTIIIEPNLWQVFAQPHSGSTDVHGKSNTKVNTIERDDKMYDDLQDARDITPKKLGFSSFDWLVIEGEIETSYLSDHVGVDVQYEYAEKKILYPPMTDAVLFDSIRNTVTPEEWISMQRPVKDFSLFGVGLKVLCDRAGVIWHDIHRVEKYYRAYILLGQSIWPDSKILERAVRLLNFHEIFPWIEYFEQEENIPRNQLLQNIPKVIGIIKDKKLEEVFYVSAKLQWHGVNSIDELMDAEIFEQVFLKKWLKNEDKEKKRMNDEQERAERPRKYRKIFDDTNLSKLQFANARLDESLPGTDIMLHDVVVSLGFGKSTHKNILAAAEVIWPEQKKVHVREIVRNETPDELFQRLSRELFHKLRQRNTPELAAYLLDKSGNTITPEVWDAMDVEDQLASSIEGKLMRELVDNEVFYPAKP